MKDQNKTKEELIKELADLRLLLAERKHAEEAIKESEEKFRVLAEKSPNMIFINCMGKVVYANKHCEDVMGYTREEFYADDFNFMEMIAPEFREMVMENYKRHSRGEEVNPFEYALITKTGNRIETIITTKLISFAGKSAILGIITDITERKRMEDALRASEKRYRDLADNALIGIYRTNITGEILYANEALLNIFEYGSRDDFMNEKAVSWYKEPDVRGKLIERLKRDGSVRDFEAELTTKDGKVKCVLMSANLTGDIISGMIMDITERVKNEEALRLSEKKYRDLYDNAPDMYHALDKNGVIIDCNETEAAMLGYKKEEIIGRHLTDFFTEKSKEFFKKDFPMLNKEKTQLNLEREFVKKDGSVFHANLNVISEFDEKGKLLGTKTIARDITERKKLEEELLKVEKLESLGILAGGIAHDFNNILTTIMGNISLALMYLKPEDQNFQRLIDAEKASLRARDLTQQLLTFSRGGAPVRKSTSIKELIKESAGFALRGSNVRCEINIPEDIWPVKIDEGQISQVIHNLVINADQAMPEGGVIDITAVNTIIKRKNELKLSEGKYVKTTIKDHGVGIPEGYLNKIFDPYFTTKHKGSGLGLAISFSIIKKHEGHIVVESGLKSGTTFHIYIPASEEQTLATMKEVQDTVKGKGRILVMDDDESIREVLGFMLQKIGYDTGFTQNGNEAVELYRKAAESGKQYDAVIIDLTIPGGMGGKETIQKLRQIDPDVRAIVSSGYSNDPVMSEFEKYGFKDVIAKPYKISQLSKVLHKVLSKPG